MTPISSAASLDALIANESEIFLKRQPQSRDMIERARTVLAGGATSNWQIADPQAVWMTHGKGPKLYDVDGTEYSDFHGGYGVSVVGHAHPKIVAAVSERVQNGTHFAQPTEDAIVVAENLRERFGQPLWRFGNSGTEVHHGRRPPDACLHRARPDPQGRGLLPRSPRLGRGVGLSRCRATRSAPPTLRPALPTTPASRTRSSISWSSCRSTTSPPWSALSRHTPARSPA